MNGLIETDGSDTWCRRFLQRLRRWIAVDACSAGLEYQMVKIVPAGERGCRVLSRLEESLMNFDSGIVVKAEDGHSGAALWSSQKINRSQVIPIFEMVSQHPRFGHSL